MKKFRELLADRPLIFVGYSIPEVDVDIVYALQQYRQRDERIKRWQLLARRDYSPTGNERLRQMGVTPRPFEVSSIGYAAIPGKLRAARRPLVILERARDEDRVLVWGGHDFVQILFASGDARAPLSWSAT
jgi:hypothetical protein